MGNPRDFKSLWGFFWCQEKERKLWRRRFTSATFRSRQPKMTSENFFAKSGEVESVKIITDAHTGNPKGFGFVEMATSEDAKKAIEALNGATFMERATYR